MQNSIVRPLGRDMQNVLIGFVGEHEARTFFVRTRDDLTGYTISLVIGDVDCGAMTKAPMPDGSTMLSLTLTSDMLGKGGDKVCQLLMTKDTIVRKSSQFRAYVGASNDINSTAPDSATIIIISEKITELVHEAALDAIAEVQGVIDSIPPDYSALSAQVDTNTEDIEGLKADLGVYAKVKGYYINLTVDPVDLTNPLSSSSGLAYSIIDCAEGDVFVVNAEGGASARAWAFIDNNNHVLSMANANVTVTNLELTAPENAVKLVINDKGDGVCYKVGNNIASKVGSLEGLEIEDVFGDLHDADSGLFNIDSFLFSESTEDIAFVRGMRGSSEGDSCEVVGNNYFSCTNLIPVSDGDILTVINLMPEKFRFNVRGYTENEENSGVLIRGGAKVLNADLTESGSYSSDYSNTINAVYKNTVEIIKPLDTTKYISVHARTFGNVNSTDKDREELNKYVRVIRKNPRLNSAFLPSEIPLANIPKITSAKRTKVGQYAELVGYGYVTINTTNKTMAVGAGFILKSGKTRVNNPTIDFSELTTEHQTIYYDMTDSTIKITGYANYPNLENVENTLYLGSVWAANTMYPVGYFSLNTNMDIVVDGVKQLPRLSYFRGKTIACFGDSICLGRTTSSGTTTHLLQDILSKEYGIKATNYAVGGACWCHRADKPHDLSALVPASTIDTDFILLFAGTNDYGTNRQLGTIGDAPSGDEGNTFYAAMHYVLQHIFTQKPNAEVAIVTPTFRSYVSSGGSGDTYNTVRNSAGCTLGDYSDAMIEVAKLYNVPILDMRKMGPINKFNYASMLEEQSEGDHLYLHPKDATYDILYHKICNWLMTVL